MDQKKVQFKVMLPPAVEQRFREAAMRRFGYRKGALGKAAEWALADWAKNNKVVAASAKGISDPVKAIEGLLAGVPYTSVELQHKAGEWRAKRYAAHRR